MRLDSVGSTSGESRILIVDDEPSNLNVLERLLRRVGYDQIRTTADSHQVEEIFGEFNPDILLLDLHMPGMDGFQVMEALRDRIPTETYFPILILTADQEPETKQKALALGANDFVTKPFEVTEVLLRIRNLLETRELHRRLQAYNETLEEKVTVRTKELAEAQREILRRLARAAEYRDDITGRHAERVGVLSALLAHDMEVGEDLIPVIRQAAPLHDVGKIGIPDAILMKPGPLTPQEFEVMKSHTVIGERILSGTEYRLLETARVIAATHHEKWDGTGYTPGMSREEIPLVGRIVAVADVFDSLTNERPYKSASTYLEAAEEIRRCRGTHFDPSIVDAFDRIFERFEDMPFDDLVGVQSEVFAEGPAEVMVEAKG